MSATTHEFKTEAKQLLDLMIHSVYSNKEIFLRELISNASDALDKLRFAGLTDDNLRALTEDLHIRLEADAEKRFLSIADNGIGMHREDLIQFIGTIAKSGTKEFLAMLKEAQEKKEGMPDFIGQFGVGFYSSFMVADKVRVISRKAGEDQAWLWESSGDGSYTIDSSTRETCGTTVELTFKEPEKDDEDAQDFTAEWVIRDIVRRYSDFVAYPIKMRISRTEIEKDDDGKPKKDGKEIEVVEDQTLNSMKAIWTRPEKEVTDEEYKDFYKHLSHDWTDPLKWIYYRAEGALSEFKALLYLPTKPPFEMFLPKLKHGINLYIKRVFIMQDCEELIPEYLRFVKGVVDSDDLTLNISREILQQSRQIQTIRKALTKKVLDTIKGLRTDDRDKFLDFWGHFGAIIKEGLFKETGDQDKLFEVCVFHTTASPSDVYTIDEYIERMKEGQDSVYYLTGDSREVLENSPHLETFREKGYEVLLLTDPVDEIWTSMMRNCKGKKLVPIGKGNVELGTEEERKTAEEERKNKETEWKDLLEYLKDKLTEHVKEVRLSSRLTNSASCLVSDHGDMSPHLEALLKSSGRGDLPKVKRILELNPKHPIFDKMQGIFKLNQDDSRLADYALLLHGQAILAEGGQLPDPAAFTRKVSEMMVNAL